MSYCQAVKLICEAFKRKREPDNLVRKFIQRHFLTAAYILRLIFLQRHFIAGARILTTGMCWNFYILHYNVTFRHCEIITVLHIHEQDKYRHFWVIYNRDDLRNCQLRTITNKDMRIACVNR